MGLLEKALEYKKELNSRGRETVMDHIKGPAETEFSKSEDEAVPDSPLEIDDIVFLKDEDLKDINETAADAAAQESPDLKSETLGDTAASLHESAEQRAASDDTLLELDDDFLLDDVITDMDMPKHDSEADDLFALPDEEESADFSNETPNTGLKFTSIEEENKEPGSEASDDLIDDDDILGPEDDPEYVPSESDDKPESVEAISESAEELIDDNADLSLKFEVENEIIKAGTRDELYDTVLFSLMGQIGSTSSSILIEEKPGGGDWKLVLSRGVRIDADNLSFSSKKGILLKLKDNPSLMDLDDYKNSDELLDDYLLFLSVDVRYLSPILYHGEMIGVIMIGEKVAADLYTENEKAFISFISETAGIALHSLIEHDRLSFEIDDLKKNISEIRQIDRLQDSLSSDATFENLKNVIRSEFERYGIISFAFYVLREEDSSYYPLITEDEDFISLSEKGGKISTKSRLIKHLGRSGSPVVIERFESAEIIRETFSDKQIKRMSMFRAYPFVLGEKNSGFIIVFKVRDEFELSSIDKRIKAISKFIFGYAYLIKDSDVRCNRYVDNIETVYTRLGREIDNARDLNIPLTLVLLSIKNFKRYYSRYGEEKARELLRDMEKVITTRLSDSDFSMRYSRNRFLIVLPGKDKKFAVPLANAIRNKFVDMAGSPDNQILMTYLTAQFPQDGNDAFTLLDAVE